MTSLADKKTLVMGASSSVGIGAAVAAAYRTAGADVMISARREPALRDVAQTIDARYAACDVTSEESVAALFEQINHEFGRLDVAVFASGLNHFAPVAKFDPQRAMPTILTQLVGGLLFIKHAAPLMPSGGAIILISSLTARLPAFGTAVYAGTKAALEQVTRIAALEYAGQGLRINGIAPGMTRTDMTEMMFDNPGLERAVVRETPLGRMGTPDDIASAALWLADPSCFLTGETLPVSGGAELRRIPTFDEMQG